MDLIVRREKYKKHRKIHFLLDGKNEPKTACGIHNVTSSFATTEDWDQVTCGNCIAAKYTAIRNFRPIPETKEYV